MRKNKPGLLFALLLAMAAGGSAAQSGEKPSAERMQAMMREMQAGPKERTVLIAGRVLRADATPAAGARLYVTWIGVTSKPGYLDLVADKTGRFRRQLKITPAPFAAYVGVSALDPGKGFAWAAHPVNEPSTLGHLVLRLERGGALTGRLVRLDGKPASGVELSVAGIEPRPRITAGEDQDPQRTAFLFSARLLPKGVAQKLYHATTDSAGKFTLAGLPPVGSIRLKTGGGLRLAPGSQSSIPLDRAEQASAGILVALQPASLRVHITDAKTGKAAAGVPTIVMPQAFGLSSIQRFSGGDPEEAGGQIAMLGAGMTDAKGDHVARQLPPGEYKILVQGGERKVTVREGQNATLELKARTGALKGRILDASGKPAANVPVNVDTSPDPMSGLFGGFSSMMGGQGREKAATTDSKGEFSIEMFPWESDSITVRAVKGNDQAEWSGKPATIGASLDLRMKLAALVSVGGRLVDQNHKPAGKSQVSVVRWQTGPRISWLLNASQATVNADGGFRIDGLRRGEAFTLLAGSPFAQMSSGTGKDEPKAFESPRFVTPQSGESLDLGEMVVHQAVGGEEILQLYGIDSREQLSRLGSLMTPGASDDDAMKALTRYVQAAESGDLDTVRKLTARVSAGWSEERSTFLRDASIRPPSGFSLAGVKQIRPMRFVPRISLAYMIALSEMRGDFSPFGFSFSKALRKVDSEPDWKVFLSGRSSGVRVSGILHRESGEWRVVNASSFFGQGIEELFLAISSRRSRPMPSSFDRPATIPAAVEMESARSAGEKYLAAWSGGNDAVLIGLTSPLSNNAAPDLSALHRINARRVDEGVCPVSTPQTIKLTPLTDLTAWEQEWLINFSETLNELGGVRSNPSQRKDAKGYPGQYVSRGDIATFRYDADGRDFLMLLAKQSGRWKVLEPAVPL